MDGWIPIGEWQRCADMARPGIVFEIRNTEGLTLRSPCSPGVPRAPWDWRSPPREFRPVAEAPAERSSPLPEPKGG